MIAFCCDACGKQFKLGPEFVGRSTTCTGCKSPLTVPLPDKAILAAPPSPRLAFSCVACGMKFNVKPEFAGRSTQCPTCKKPLIVPSNPEPIASDPTVGQIDGAPSSLARAQSSEGAPLVKHPSASNTVADRLRGTLDDAPRYIIEKELARGGMGAVMCAHAASRCTRSYGSTIWRVPSSGQPGI